MMICLGDYWERVNISATMACCRASFRDPNDQLIWATAKMPPENAKGRHQWEGNEYFPADTFLTNVIVTPKILATWAAVHRVFMSTLYTRRLIKKL
ncbi:hypothetical protein BXT84_08975 [Sulfobacillus thermotolerans]|uniref:Uncharacterized protein n=1 Tax=Sulfobacillus thermotolerans TaxID=338644 RepID=A0ABM6RRS8_9FIRM|nr:hypothetical protein BXT84_08975 [Sulfobacillus thermotolerans]